MQNILEVKRFKNNCQNELEFPSTMMRLTVDIETAAKMAAMPDDSIYVGSTG